MFKRVVKSRAFFEQMKGRGVFVIKPDDLQSVTPDAKAKDHLVIVDAVCVCVCEKDKTDWRALRETETREQSLNVRPAERVGYEWILPSFKQSETRERRIARTLRM